MSDLGDLLGGSQASRAIVPTRRVAAPTRRTTVPKARLTVAPKLATGVKVPKLAPPKLTSKKDKKDDKGFWGSLLSIPGSAAKAVGSGIMGLPTLVGKGVQEVGGLGELVFDNVLDAINEDIYTSRLETDYQKGKELGLKGDELYAYSMQRQHPFFGAMFGSMAKTGGRLAELGSLGFYNYGQEGIDYAKAFREGDLGAFLVEDVGNLILAGRLTGAGNVVGRAGAAIGETAPRLGGAVSRAGRIIEEPIGEAVRTTGGLVAKAAPKIGEAVEGMRYAPDKPTVQRLATRASAISEAETPVRMVFQQIGDAYRAGQETKRGQLDIDVAAKMDEQAAAQQAGDTQRVRELQTEIDLLEKKRRERTEGTGVIRAGRNIARRTKLLGERAGQGIIQSFARLRDYGVAPERVEVYRARAQNLRAQADQVEQAASPYPEYLDVTAGTESPQVVQARNLRAAADTIDRMADLKEQYPDIMSGPLPKEVQEAAIHLAEKAHALLALADQGMSLDDMVRAASDPRMFPALAESGMQPTAEGVALAVEVLRAMRGEQTSLNPAQMMRVTAIYNVLKDWSQEFQEMVMRGEGIPEGPLPFTAFELYPTPAFVLAELSKNSREARAVEAILDQAVADMVGAAVDAGVLPPEVLKEWKINIDEPSGNYKRLAKLDPASPGYRVAYEIGKLSYRQLLNVAPEFMMNPRIYPGNVRPTVLTQRQAIRRVTGYDTENIALRLAELETEFDTLIDANVLTGIGNDIADALNPQKRITKTVWSRALNRLETIRRTAEERRLALESKSAVLTQEQQAIIAKLTDLEDAVNAARKFVEGVAAEPLAKSNRLLRVEGKRDSLAAERDALEQELAGIDEQLTVARQTEMPDAPELRRFIDENQVKIDETSSRIDEIDAELERTEREYADLNSEIEYFLGLTDQQLSDMILDYDELQASGMSAADLQPSTSRTPTPGELKGYKDRKLAELQKVQDEAADYGVNTLAAGGMPKGRSNAPRGDLKDDPKRYTIDGLEDWRGPVQQVLGNGKMYQAFLDEFTVWDERNAPSGAKTGQSTADEMPSMETRSVDGGAEPRTTEEWLIEYAETFKRLYEARMEAKRLKTRTLKSLERDYMNEVGGAVSEADVMPYGQSGLTPNDILRSYKYLDRDTLITARRNASLLRRQVENLQAERARLNEALRALRKESGDFNARLRPPMPKDLLQRSTQIRARLRQLKRQQSQVPRSLRAATAAEPREARVSERARLRPLGLEVRRPEVGAEGPAAGVIRAPRQRIVDAQARALNKQDARRTKLLRTTRRALAEQEGLATAAEAALGEPLLRPSYTPEGMPFGPELFREGEQPIYLPAGPTKGMLPERDIQAVQRGEGATQQTRLQATRERYSGSFVLSLPSMANRIKEITDQQYRNMGIDEILADPTITSRVDKILSEQDLQQIEMDAQQAVAAQAIDRTSPEFESAVNSERGLRIQDELSRRGYEVVTGEAFDETTGGHIPLRTLSADVRPDQVAMNSPVMRKGIADKFFGQFEPQRTRNVPVLVQRALDKVGNVTSKWKSVVLPLSLRWQIGDAVGIVLFAWTRGDISPVQLAKRIKETIGRMTDPNDPRLGMIMFGDVLQAAAFSDPVLSAGFGAALAGRGLRAEDVLFYLEEARKAQADPNYRPSNAAMNFFNSFRNRAFKVNEAINSIGRSAVFIEKLDRLLTSKGRSLDEIGGPGSFKDAELTQAISDAVDATNQTLGAFSDLSPFEKQVMRQVFPFWTWLKFINKAAFELAADSPERVLLAAHLGSMVTEGDDTGLADWLRGKTPVLGYFVDLNFLNPYADAALFTRNPFTDVLETGASVSPAISFPLTAANELYYGQTGKNLPLLGGLSRPGYLEGRPEATTRGFGDVLGGIGYKGLQTFGGPFRNVLDILPTGTVPFTDVATGPVARFGQGSLRTSGAFAEPRLGPIAGRISPLLRTFGIPAPLIEQDKAMKQARDQAKRDRNARLRRVAERKAAGQ